MKPFDISSRVTMAELLGNSREYIVPHFQRDYSWGEEVWEELWEDIRRMGPDGRHYMGYIVLQELPDDRPRRLIIDGQQRIATLSIFALAVISLLDEADGSPDNRRRRDELRKFLEWNDPVTASLTPRPRLALSDENNGFYRDHILRLRKPAGMSRVSRSNRRMWRALEFFRERTRAHFDGTPTGEGLARLLSETVANGLFFTEMRVSDEESAYAIFETLNARGAMLSSPDLLKNFLFSAVQRGGGGEEDIKRLQRQWGEMLSALGRHPPTAFMRHLWHSLGGEFVQQKGLFRAMRRKIESAGGGAETVFDMMDELEDGAQAYADMLSPTPSAWGEKAPLSSLQNLNLCGATSHFPLALAAVRKWGRKSPEFAKLLRRCADLSFRRIVIGGQNPNDLERVCAQAAAAVQQDGESVAEICGRLKAADLRDDLFVSAFSVYDADSRSAQKLAKHILLEIERHASGDRGPRIDPETSDITIEHVLPQDPGEGWDAFPPDIDRFVWRLGNLTLLKSSHNRDCDNLSFADKRDIYRGSEFKMTSELAHLDEWTPQALESRQRRFAELAKAIWRLE